MNEFSSHSKTRNKSTALFRMMNMVSCKKSTNADRCGGNPFTSIHPDIIQTHILSRLDGATLASISCASPQLRSLCSDDRIWRDICNSTWPSTADPRVVRAISAFPSGHRSFYSESFLSSSQQLPEDTCLSGTSELIFAVDIYYRDQVMYSKVLETRSADDWSFELPFIPLKLEGDCRRLMSLLQEQLRVSWIVIDPTNKRAVNVASHQAVDSWSEPDGCEIQLSHQAVDSWSEPDGCEIQLCYATVATEELIQCAVLVTCSREEWGELHVKEVEMRMLNIKGKVLGETQSVGILRAAMEGERRRMDGKMEKHDYENFSRIMFRTAGLSIHREIPNWWKEEF